MSTSFAFLDNKYNKWYYQIISKAKTRIFADYYETHHIIPKCLGGTNYIENLVKLTAREHFICHWLLTKMVDNKKHQYQMWNAFSCMLYRENSNQTRYKITSKMFENIKKEGSKIKSWNLLGEKNPMYGKKGNLCPLYGKKVSEETRRKQSLAHKGKIRSIESRKKQSEKIKGRSQTSEHISKRSGINHPLYGKNLSEEIKEKIRQKILEMPLYTCEHCGKSTTKGNYRRWHSNNCKVITCKEISNS